MTAPADVPVPATLRQAVASHSPAAHARPLSAEKVGHAQQVARRIAAVPLLGPALDASYQDCVQAHG